LDKAKLDAATISKLETMAKSDPNPLTKATAIDALAKLKKDSYKDMFAKATKDSSYSVAGSALDGLALIDSMQAYKISKELSKDVNKGRLASSINNVIVKYGDESDFDVVSGSFADLALGNRYRSIPSFTDFLKKVTDLTRFKKGVDLIVSCREEIPQGSRGFTDPVINRALKNLADKKDAAGAKELADYVKSKLPADKK
jgi:aminopeptidase N